jgi:hypothetical protein
MKAALSRTTWLVGARAKTTASLWRICAKAAARRNRGARVASHRLQQHVGLNPDFGELLQHREAVGGIGDDNRSLGFRPTPLISVPWNVERAPNSGRNCFGRTSREAGHSRVPAPPHMMRGIIRLSIALCRYIP